MHREIQIKQFPIVTTHWWPKTRNERFVWENEQYLYRFLPLVHNHVQVIWVRTHIRCVTCVCARSGSRCIHTGRRRQRLTEGVSEAWCWRAVIVTTTNHILLWCCMNGIGYLHEAIWLADASVGAWKVASAPRFRHALRQALTTDAPCECSVIQSARTHTSHTGCVCALRSLGHGCVQEVKNNIITVRFLTQTARSCLRVLVHVLFPSYRDSDLYLPLYDWQTRTVWPKNIKIGSTEEKRYLHLGCPWGKLIDTKF